MLWNFLNVFYFKKSNNIDIISCFPFLARSFQELWCEWEEIFLEFSGMSSTASFERQKTAWTASFQFFWYFNGKKTIREKFIEI